MLHVFHAVMFPACVPVKLFNLGYQRRCSGLLLNNVAIKKRMIVSLTFLLYDSMDKLVLRSFKIIHVITVIYRDVLPQKKRNGIVAYTNENDVYIKQ